MNDKIQFWKRLFPTSGEGTFGDYDYTPSLITVLIWIAVFLIIGAVLACFITPDNLTDLTTDV